VPGALVTAVCTLVGIGVRSVVRRPVRAGGPHPGWRSFL